MDNIQAPWIGLCGEEYEEELDCLFNSDYDDYLSQKADELWSLEQDEIALEELQKKEEIGCKPTEIIYSANLS